MRWLDAVNRLTMAGQSYVMVTVIALEGSAPRNPGARMVVDILSSYDTIGGGNLEYQVIARARKMLSGESIQHEGQQIVQHTFNLGPDLSQCCGGRVTVLFELMQSPALNIALFGAGHVGHALVKVLADIDCRVSWFDSRAEQLPDKVAVNISPLLMQNPHDAVENCAPGTCFLVMTHSHDMDFELVEAILSRPDFSYCGLIASQSKARSFKSRLKRKAFTEDEIANLTAPVGIDSGGHKEPMAVAVGIAAQLLELNRAIGTPAKVNASVQDNGHATDRF